MNTDHVVIDCGERPELWLEPEEQLVLTCLHCGHRYVLALPASLRMTAAVCRVYAREHAHCRPTAAAREEKP